MAYKQNFEPQEALIDGEWQIIKHSQTKRQVLVSL
jgi:arginyl-tRNA--protein-N-Asp/Glu arginylyltransferase